MKMDARPEPENTSITAGEKTVIDPLRGKSAGKALQRVFHQEELHKRIEEQKASVSHLMNDIRRRMFVHLCANPCDHVRGVARTFNLSAPTATWHLSVLTECRYLSRKSFKKKNIFWPTGMVKPADLVMSAIMREPNTPAILAAVKSRSDGHVTESYIVGEVDLSQQNTHLWLGRLTEAGILIKDGTGPGTGYDFTEQAFEIVDIYKDRAKVFSEYMLSLLETDGLRPKNARFRGTRLHVQVTVPGRKQRLTIECNPLADLARILK